MSTTEVTAIRAFEVGFDESELMELRRRIQATRWPERETVADAWEQPQLFSEELRAAFRSLRRYPTPDGAGTATEFAIDPPKLHDAFAADLPTQQAAVLAATQRPVSELAFTEPSGPPAWKSLPSWTVLASPDKAAGTDVVRSMAERAGATITEAEGSHVIMISQPDIVVDVIRTAAAAVGQRIAAPPG